MCCFASSEGETRKACEAVASYLHLNPNDEVQNRNKEFYDGVEEVTQDMFVPRKVCGHLTLTYGECNNTYILSSLLIVHDYFYHVLFYPIIEGKAHSDHFTPYKKEKLIQIISLNTKGKSCVSLCSSMPYCPVLTCFLIQIIHFSVPKGKATLLVDLPYPHLFPYPDHSLLYT